MLLMRGKSRKKNMPPNKVLQRTRRIGFAIFFGLVVFVVPAATVIDTIAQMIRRARRATKNTYWPILIAPRLAAKNGR